MRQRFIAAVSIGATLLLAAAASPGLAQNQLPRPGQLPPPGGAQQPQQRPQPAQPQQQQQQAQPPQQQGAGKPYKTVAVTAPKSMDDPSFEAFRKQLGAIAEKKDRAALAALVSRSFFWLGEKGDKADKKKSGIDNLAKAIGLDGKDADGWDTLAGFAADPTAAPYPEKKDTVCAPAQPDFNDDDFGALIKATGTEDADWGYPVQAGIEMHATPQANSPVIEKLGAHFVRVLEDEAAGNQQVPMLKVVAPSGKTGYVPADAISPLGNDEMCYVKEGGAWKIAGFAGGE
jgi:hypothetical protein